jgi:catechol-2,3-dioxygenase
MQQRTLDRSSAVPAKLAHVVLRTSRFEESIQWYTRVLGARPVHRDSFLCFMTYDDEHHRIALVNTPDAPAPASGAVGLEHVAFTFAALEDLLNQYLRLKDEGIEPYWTINHGPTTSMYYRDPDGNQVELQVDNFDSLDDLFAWFRSGAFSANPIGVDFDPDELVRRYLDGEPLDKLLQRADR